MLPTREPALFTERDTVNADGTFNRRIILKVALSRARAERDLDMLVAAHGPTLRPPTGISQDAVRAWRRVRAAQVDPNGLALTPFRTLLAEQLRRAWSAARAVRSACPSPTVPEYVASGADVAMRTAA